MVTYDRFQAKLEWVRKWIEKHPELTSRLEKAAFLHVEETLSPDAYKVRSETRPNTWYVVQIQRRARTSKCSCPDNRESRCKHQLAVALYEKTQPAK